jgi:hypothetical protein
MNFAKMNGTFSLTPGFSPVTVSESSKNRFNGFSVGGKPLKRLVISAAVATRLKPGVNGMARLETDFLDTQ